MFGFELSNRRSAHVKRELPSGPGTQTVQALTVADVVVTGFASVLVLLPTMLNGIIGPALGIPLVGIGFIIALMRVTLISSPHFPYPLLSMAWVILGALLMMSSYALKGLPSPKSVYFFLAALLLFVGSATPAWVPVTFTVMGVLASMHLAATLLFFFVPSAYTDWFRPLFYSETLDAVGYPSALTSNSGYNAVYLGVLLVLVAVPILHRWSGRWPPPATLLFVVPILLALFLTGKRSIPVIVVLVVAFAFISRSSIGSFPRTVRIGTLGMMSLFAIALVVPEVRDTFNRFLPDGDRSDVSSLTSGRTELWDHAISGWREKPLLGHGTGSYVYEWPNGISVSGHAHNEFLNLLFENGLFGAIAFVGLALASLVVAFETWRALSADKGTNRGATLAAIAFALQATILIYGFTFGMLLHAVSTLMIYMLAVSASLSLQAGQQN